MTSEAPAPYDRIGGALGVRKLVDRFYDLMEQLPAAAHIRSMHPENMKSSREKFYEFLSGWLGGPPLFMQRRGHPRLRMRHMPFPIDDAARDAWLMCMEQAMQDCIEDKLLIEMLRGVPGLDVFSNGGPGTQTSVVLRGSTPGQTLVLIDGIRIGDPTSTDGSVDFGINLIPHTSEVTTLGALAQGTEINLEIDTVARYLKRLEGLRG